MASMEEICSQLKPELDRLVGDMNTISCYEFIRFMPLYQKDGIEQLGEDEYGELCEEWRSRISLYDKICIIDPNVSDGDNVILTLPAIYSRLRPINDAGDGAERIADYFADTIIRDTRFNGEMVKSLDLMKQAISLAQGPISDRASSIKEYIRMRADIEGTATTIDKPESSEDSSEYVWE